MNSKTTGSEAEQLVAAELLKRGYKVRELNWRTKIAEIDIVAEKDGAIYFVEVKFRSTDAAGDGFDYITEQKLRHMFRAAEAWVLAHDWQGEYELLAASVTGEVIDIRHIA